MTANNCKEPEDKEDPAISDEDARYEVDGWERGFEVVMNGVGRTGDDREIGRSRSGSESSWPDTDEDLRGEASDSEERTRSQGYRAIPMDLGCCTSIFGEEEPMEEDKQDGGKHNGTYSTIEKKTEIGERSMNYSNSVGKTDFGNGQIMEEIEIDLTKPIEEQIGQVIADKNKLPLRPVLPANYITPQMQSLIEESNNIHLNSKDFDLTPVQKPKLDLDDGKIDEIKNIMKSIQFAEPEWGKKISDADLKKMISQMKK
uniref:Phosphoprotein n=1 Tax=Rhabditophanes sp. KR3021 TaxID=114890 RepID=A0AC35TSW3_9BILA